MPNRKHFAQVKIRVTVRSPFHRDCSRAPAPANNMSTCEAVQHTLDHFNCKACEAIREGMSQGALISACHTFREAAQIWLESHELAGNFNRARFLSPRTLRDYQQYIQAPSKFFGGMRLDQIDKVLLRGYQIQRNAQAGANKINQELGVVRRILRDAGLWTPELAQHYKPLQVEPSDVQRAMSPEEQSRFLQVASSRKKWEVVYWYAVAALQTTCSNCEMRGLHLSDVNVYQEVLEVREAHAKNVYRIRTIELSRDALWALDRLCQRARSLGATSPEHYLFPRRISRKEWDARRSMSESGIKRGFDEVRNAAGVPWLRHHDLRHCAITRLAEAGVPIEVIMAMAGHIGPRMTRHYTHVSQAAKRKAVVMAFDSGPATLWPRAVPTRAR